MRCLRIRIQPIEVHTLDHGLLHRLFIAAQDIRRRRDRRGRRRCHAFKALMPSFVGHEKGAFFLWRCWLQGIWDHVLEKGVPQKTRRCPSARAVKIETYADKVYDVLHLLSIFSWICAVIWRLE